MLDTAVLTRTLFYNAGRGHSNKVLLSSAAPPDISPGSQKTNLRLNAMPYVCLLYTSPSPRD
eukprot:3491019-Alexandrium_andersonii.AAC.1